MPSAFICDGIRTPIGRYGGALAEVRTDNLAALPIAALIRRNPAVDWAQLDDVVFGCANQAGEDNRNVARMAALLAGLPVGVPGVTINRLCGSGLDAVGSAARAIRAGEASLIIAGGVESSAEGRASPHARIDGLQLGRALAESAPVLIAAIDGAANQMVLVEIGEHRVVSPLKLRSTFCLKT